MRRVFVDTSALVALLDAADPRHADVRSAFAARESDVLLTHGYVIAESLAVVRRRLGSQALLTLLDDVLPAIELVPVEPDDFATALQQFRASLPSAISLVDQISFGVMAKERMDLALALDADFPAAGIETVP